MAYPFDKEVVFSAGSRGSRGFTLFEMMVVLIIMVLISAVVLPELMPVLVFSRIEGAARHVAAYGEAAMAQSILMRERIVVKFDLGKQEYWAVHWVNQSSSIFDDEEETAAPEEAEDRAFLDPMNEDAKSTGEAMGSGAPPGRTKFDAFARAQLEARAKQVEHEGILDEIGPLFEKPFALDDEENQEEELFDPLLTRTPITSGVTIETITPSAGGSGTTDIELSPTGLSEPVLFHIKNTDDDYYTVVWDPITAGARIREGKASLEEM